MGFCPHSPVLSLSLSLLSSPYCLDLYCKLLGQRLISCFADGRHQIETPCRASCSFEGAGPSACPLHHKVFLAHLGRFSPLLSHNVPNVSFLEIIGRGGMTALTDGCPPPHGVPGQVGDICFPMVLCQRYCLGGWVEWQTPAKWQPGPVLPQGAGESLRTGISNGPCQVGVAGSFPGVPCADAEPSTIYADSAI